LVPEQKTPAAAVEWNALRLTGTDALAVRASKKLRNEELLVTTLGSTVLRKHLDEVPLWRGDHVAVRQLVEDFARYLYLPRLVGPEVLVKAIRDGVALLTWQTDTFAYAESYDETVGRYRGVRGGQLITLGADDPGLIVKADVARRQLESEAPEPARGVGGEIPSPAREAHASASDAESAAGTRLRPRRFHGTVRLDPARVGRDAGRIAEEVIAHLAGQPGAEVTVILEIDARLPGGVDEHTVRVVTENSRTLKFTNHAFEAE